MRSSLLFQLLPFLLIFVTVAVIASQSGIDPETIQIWLDDKGAWGPVMFVALYAVLQALFVSSHIFIIAANAVWPPELAIAYSWLGAMGSGLISFVFARFVAREWVQKRLPDKIRQYDEKLEESGFLTVLLLRSLFFTSPPLQLGLGISGVRFMAFLGGTALGNLPPILLSTFAFSNIIQWLQS
jgi:uncharacterized membrane protein YdjX (TVP38/TMEM64 family)